MKPDGQPHRVHPDLFTAEEATTYLHLDTDTGERTLETFRSTHGLIGQKFGKAMMYHRRHLDSFILRMFGITADPRATAI